MVNQLNYMNNKKGEPMKTVYEAPEMMIIHFSKEDILTTSGGGNAILPDDEF